MTRTAKALSGWLGGGLQLRPDLDQLDALAPDREALWARLDGASFLTTDEKRAAAGYGPKEGGKTAEGALSRKYRSDQARDDQGRWVDEGGGDGEPGDADPNVQNVSRRRGAPSGSPAQEARLAVAANQSRDAVRRTQELDPEWRPEAGISTSIEGLIRYHEQTAAAAQARLAEITRDAVPNTNPSWGVNRLRKELNEQGYQFAEPSRSLGYIYKNPLTSEEVRIMERPTQSWRTDPPQKHYNDYYYRYRPSINQGWGAAVTIPNK